MPDADVAAAGAALLGAFAFGMIIGALLRRAGEGRFVYLEWHRPGNRSTPPGAAGGDDPAPPAADRGLSDVDVVLIGVAVSLAFAVIAWFAL